MKKLMLTLMVFLGFSLNATDPAWAAEPAPLVLIMSERFHACQTKCNVLWGANLERCVANDLLDNIDKLNSDIAAKRFVAAMCTTRALKKGLANCITLCPQ